MRVSKWVVRPGRRGGGTTIIFALKEGTVVRFTVVRVYPSCERVGSFRVRAHAGVNRVRFRGRLGGRPLAEGTYRLVAQARGQEAAAATVTIVVVRGKTSAAELRRARRANACSASEAHEIVAAIGAASTGSNDGSAGKKRGVRDSLVGAAKGVVKEARGLTAGIGAAIEDSPFSDPLVLIVVGLLMLAVTLLATLFLLQVVRTLWLR